jgi:protein SCO1/2
MFANSDGNSGKAIGPGFAWGAAILLLFLAQGPRVACAQLSPLTGVLQDVGIDQHLGDAIPLDLKFRDELGNTVPLSQYVHDKPVVLLLVYYKCPMLCTQVLNGFLKTSQAIPFVIGQEYEVVTVSIDPRETPELARRKKQQYTRLYQREGAAEGWHFLTGDQQSISELTRIAGYRYRFDDKSGQFAHGSGLMVLTPEGVLSRYFYGIDFPPNDLRLALVESSASRIGSAVDQILLLCYHYDPSIGKYGFAIATSLRVAGIGTLLGLGGMLCLLIRYDRRRQKSFAERLAADEDDTPTEENDITPSGPNFH